MLISIIIIALIAAFTVFGLFFNVLNSILSWFFGLFRRGRQTADNNDSESERPQPRQAMHGQSRKKRKVIDSNDGEYVDFEEVKR